MIDFTRITGTILALVFGSHLLFLQLRQSGIQHERQFLTKSQNYSFASITRTPKMQRFSPYIKPRYFFSLSGRYQNQSFEVSEQVNSRLYHLYSVGSNIEVVIGQRPDRSLLIHIRNNQLEWSDDLTMLRFFSRMLFYFGLIGILFGFILLPLLGQIFGLRALQKKERPRPDDLRQGTPQPGQKSMKNSIELAISPCPNDTFIFYKFIETGLPGLDLQIRFLDVDELNQQAMQKQAYAITKLSFFAMAQLQNSYRLVDAGGALGRGCGPLWLAKTAMPPSQALQECHKILIPGQFTTAHLLLRLYLAEKKIDTAAIEFQVMRYDKIMPAMLAGEADFGLIIHEERFTYKEHNLYAILDLGEWWESCTGHPIPLGCIAVRNDFAPQWHEQIEAMIKQSIQFSMQNPAQALPFIKEHSQSMADDVVQSHIKLYVNDYSLGYGKAGQAAIQELFCAPAISSFEYEQLTLYDSVSPDL